MKIEFIVERDNEVIVYLDDVKSGKLTLNIVQNEQLIHIIALGVAVFNEEILSPDNPHTFMQIGKV